MPRILYELQYKRQTKANDCWWASIQMLRSGLNERVKPTGRAAENHRNIPVWGRMLDFGSARGDQVADDNELTPVVVGQIDLDDIATLYKALDECGPLIVGGRFGLGPLGVGHFIVIAGCDTAQSTVTVYDPAWPPWGGARMQMPWREIVEKIHKLPSNNAHYADGAILRNKVNRFTRVELPPDG